MHVLYNPYLIAMGTVGWDFSNPEMVMIGTEDGSETGDARELINFYRPMMITIHDMWSAPGMSANVSRSLQHFHLCQTESGQMIQDVAEKQGNINVDVVTER